MKYYPTSNEMNLVAAYEDVNEIAYEDRQTHWYGDYGIYEPSLNFTKEAFESRLAKALDALQITREMLNSMKSKSSPDFRKELLLKE